MYRLIHRVSNSIFRRMGFIVRRRSATTDDMLALVAMLSDRNVDMVLDIGANRGQFAEKIFEAGYSGAIHSYEPLPAPRVVIEEKSRENPKWTISEACCLGDTNGEVEIKISMNEIASSVLNTSSSMADFDNTFKYVGAETVPIRRLDEVVPEAENVFIKVDVQGFEEQVLRGAPETLKKCVGLLMEVSFVELYEGQMLFREMINWLDDEGLTPHRFFPAYTDSRDGRWLQADVIFLRRS